MLLNKAKTEVRKSGGKMIRLYATENTDRFYEKRGMRQSDFGGEFTTHFWVPKPKPRQNPRGTTKKLPLGIAPQNLLRKPTIILRKRR
jgi:hypothetical protein